MALNGIAGDDSYWKKNKIPSWKIENVHICNYCMAADDIKREFEKINKEYEMKEYEMSRYVSSKMQTEYLEALNKAMEKMSVTATPAITTYSSSGNTANGMWYACWDSGNKGGHFVTEKDFIPTKIIYNCPATICYFPDGTKEVVKVAYDEEYIKEEGVAECIMRKLFKSRHAFLKAVNAGYENEDAEVERVLHNGSVEKIKHDELFSKLKAFTSKTE